MPQNFYKLVASTLKSGMVICCISAPYQKKNRREQNPAHPARLAVPSSYQQEQRDPGVFVNPTNSEFDRGAAYSAFMEETLAPKPVPPTGRQNMHYLFHISTLDYKPFCSPFEEAPTPMKLLPNNISMFSMVLGVLVGLAVLILLILLLIAFGFRTCRQRAAYARRKALSDQANTETTFSEADKAQQQQLQNPSSPSLHQQASSANSYGYRQGSDSGAGIGGLASTYLPHAMFASDSCWPPGLHPVPPGGNYFGEEEPGVAFPPLGRDSGSQGYIQLPVSELNASDSFRS